MCLIGVSSATRAIRDDIGLAARFDTKVLVTGDTGVGKDVVARRIHEQSPRRLGPLAMLNCAGLPRYAGRIRAGRAHSWELYGCLPRKAAHL